MPEARPRNRRVPGVALVASVLVLAVVVNASVNGQLPWTATPTAKSSPLPVTLTAVGVGTTVTAGTVAATTGLVPGLVGATTFSVARDGTSTWDVRLAVTGASGITGGETLVLAIVAGLSSQTITLAAGTAFPQVSSPLTLNGVGILVTAATLSLVSGCHTCSATVELRITPSGGPLPSFTYPYSIATAA